MFRYQRENFSEIPITALAAEGYYVKSSALQELDASQYEWILFLDCDMLALRNIDHLLERDDADILYMPEPGKKMTAPGYNSYLTSEELLSSQREGINSGTWAVRGKYYHEVMAEWRRIMDTPPLRPICTFDQSAWNRLILDYPLRKRPFEKEEIQFPLMIETNYRKHRQAALLHVCGERNRSIKLEYLQAMYCARFVADQQGYFLSLTDT